MSETDGAEPDAGGDDDEEQVVGVLRFCEACGEKTLHVDGVCTDHKVVRRRRKRRLAPRPVPEPEAVALPPRRKKKRPSWWRRNRLRFFFLVVLAIVVTAGMTQIEYSAQTGFHFYRKDGFAFGGTFIVLEDPQ